MTPGKELTGLEMQDTEDDRRGWELAAALLALTVVSLWGLYLGC